MLDDKKWEEINKFPDSVGYITGLHEINNVFYVVGVKGISTLNYEFHEFPPISYNCCYTSCRVGNNILVIGEVFHNNVESRQFNLTSKQWSDVNIETKRESFVVVNYLNKVWIVGGEERDDDRKYKTFNTIQIYDPVNNTFSLSPLKMIYARCFHKVIVYKNKLFVFGGRNANEIFNTVEMYSPDTKKFIKMAPMKIARYYFVCCRAGNLVYIISGLTYHGFTKSVEIYNLDTNVWCDGTNIPFNLPEINLLGCAVNNKLE